MFGTIPRAFHVLSNLFLPKLCEIATVVRPDLEMRTETESLAKCGGWLQHLNRFKPWNDQKARSFCGKATYKSQLGGQSPLCTIIAKGRGYKLDLIVLGS